MTLRLDTLIVRGEIINTRKNTVHGFLQLRENESMIALELTGNCDSDLAGWHIRFEAQTPPADQPGEEIDLSQFVRQQIGPTGTMTAARMIRVSDGSPLEIYRRSKMGEPQAFEWKRCLYLEWFSQNGQVVVELVDPIIDFVEHIDFEAAARPGLPEKPMEPEPVPLPPNSSANRLDESEEEDPRDETPLEDDLEEDSPSEDDPYGLFPDDLQRHLDQATIETDRSLWQDDDKSQTIREAELLDDLIAHSPGVVIGSLIENTLPRPDQLDNAQLEQALKSLLSQLALYGISLYICEHFTARDAYRLLLDDICKTERTFPELRHTQWVQTFSTFEFCEHCEAEMDREFKENERRRKEQDDPELGDEDVPF